MESIMSWAKENFDLICLLVGVLGVIVSIISAVYEVKVKKRNKRSDFPFMPDNI